MFGRFMPKEVDFYDLFNAHASEISQGTIELGKLLYTLGESPETAQQHSEAVDKIESKADTITHETISLLHSTFITPLDRDEIHRLISSMDDVLDTMQDAANTVTIYDIRRATPEAIRFGDIILESARAVQKALSMLHDMENGQAILATCRDIAKLESDADRVMRSAMSKLFRDEGDVRQLIKLKAIYELLEAVSDRAEDVANVIEGVVLENA